MSDEGGSYSRAFYSKLASAESVESCEVVARLLVDLLRPRSVVDVGCGVAQFPAAFTKAGVPEVAGIDGDWVPIDMLQIPRGAFTTHDLTRPFSAPRRYDLVVSVEVGEHLPQDSATTLVETITSLSRIVAFGAAIPLQGGTNHINERWPSYWAGLFASRGYSAIDCLRPRLLSDPRVPELLAQNLILYVHSELLPSIFPVVTSGMQDWPDYPLPLVHPKIYESLKKFSDDAPSSIALTPLLKALPALLVARIARRIGRWIDRRNSSSGSRHR